jgi:Domain of unknown function (DUF6894)
LVFQAERIGENTPMPCYYFHIRDDGVLLEDPDGIELPNLDAAREECRKLILSVLQEEGMTQEFSAKREFQVVDESGETVLVVPFGFVAGHR